MRAERHPWRHAREVIDRQVAEINAERAANVAPLSPPSPPRALPGWSRARIAAFVALGLVCWVAIVWGLVLLIGVVAPAVAEVVVEVLA